MVDKNKCKNNRRKAAPKRKKRDSQDPIIQSDFEDSQNAKTPKLNDVKSKSCKSSSISLDLQSPPNNQNSQGDKNNKSSFSIESFLQCTKKHRTMPDEKSAHGAVDFVDLQNEVPQTKSLPLDYEAVKENINFALDASHHSPTLSLAHTLPVHEHSSQAQVYQLQDLTARLIPEKSITQLSTLSVINIGSDNKPSMLKKQNIK